MTVFLLSCPYKPLEDAPMLPSRAPFLAALAVIGSAIAPTQGAPDRPPAEIYKSVCAKCHEGGVPRAPHSVEFQMLGPRAILSALESGAMQAQGAALSPAERRSVAEFLGGAALPADADSALPRCDARHSRFDTSAMPSLLGWSMTLEGSRYVPASVARLSARDV